MPPPTAKQKEQQRKDQAAASANPFATAPDTEALTQQLGELEEELAELRARFDKFFLGMEKINPNKEYESLKKRLIKMKTANIRNTAQKFRMGTLYNKFLTYERLWLRTLKEMEEGTYKRDLKRLERKNARQDERKKKRRDPSEEGTDPHAVAPPGIQDPRPEDGPAEAPEEKAPAADWAKGLLDDLEADLPEELFGEKLPPKSPAARTTSNPANPVAPAAQAAAPRTVSSPGMPAVKGPPPPPAAARTASSPGMPAVKGPPPPPSAAKVPPPPPAAAKGPPPPPGARAPPPPPTGARSSSGLPLSDDKLKQLYDAYVTAKKRCKESTEGLTMDAVASSLRKQVPKLMEEHGVKSVDFKVVIKDGKAILKAIPK